MLLRSREGEPVPETKETAPAELVFLAQEPLDPGACFEAYLYRLLGRLPLPDQYQLLSSFGCPPKKISPEYLSIAPNTKSLEYWRELIDQIIGQNRLPPQARYPLIRLANYAHICLFTPTIPQRLSLKNATEASTLKERSPLSALNQLHAPKQPPASPYLYHLLVDCCLRRSDQPQEAIEAGIQLFNHFLENNLDPFKSGREKVNKTTSKKILSLIKTRRTQTSSRLRMFKNLTREGSSVSTKLPIFFQEKGRQTPKSGETRVIGTYPLERNLAILRFLEAQQFNIVIVGPRHSGKSTLTASLIVEMGSLLDQIKSSSPEMADLQLRCTYVDLDRSTPGDVANILNASFPAERIKEKWDPEKARQAARDFTRARGNIIFADAPGGDPDDITKMVICPADLAILLIGTEDDEQWVATRNVWGEVLKNMGIIPVCHLRSRRPGGISKETGEELTSTITSFFTTQNKEVTRRNWIWRVGGRIVGLNKEVITDDPCIKHLVFLFLFDLLPLVAYERVWRENEYLAFLEKEYQAARARHMTLTTPAQ